MLHHQYVAIVILPDITPKKTVTAHNILMQTVSQHAHGIYRQTQHCTQNGLIAVSKAINKTDSKNQTQKNQYFATIKKFSHKFLLRI